MGQILRVDLTTRRTTVENLDPSICAKFIGGAGLGAWLLSRETPTQFDPLGPENTLVFATGPLAGTRIPGTDRYTVVARSPLTGSWGESDSGALGARLKRAGYDALVITGQADMPIYLWITGEGIQFRDAAHLWGKDTYEIESQIRAETHPQAEFVAIGPAGERLARLAAIMTNGKDGRAAARCGLGAVMGSKKLKAIAVHGHQSLQVADPESLATALKTQVPRIREVRTGFTRYGSAGGIVAMEEIGDLPIKNWVGGNWADGATAISGMAMVEKGALSSRYGCGNCIVTCGRVVTLNRGTYAGVDGAGPEFESVGALGSLCLVDDLDSVLAANELCNRYGLDTISVGGVIAFAMEAFERGDLTRADTDGLELVWGRGDVVIELIRRIGERRGIGWLLGEGVRRASAQLGRHTEAYAAHAKGLELPMIDPRIYGSIAVAYATSSRGACHIQACSQLVEEGLTIPDLGYPQSLNRFSAVGKGELVARMQNYLAALDSLKVCKFYMRALLGQEVVDWTNYVTGWQWTVPDLLRAGERIFNLKRVYNVRCGMTRADDQVDAPRIMHELRQGDKPSALPDLGRMLDDYYAFRGWDQHGAPMPATLAALDLSI